MYVINQLCYSEDTFIKVYKHQSRKAAFINNIYIVWQLWGVVQTSHFSIVPDQPIVLDNNGKARNWKNLPQYKQKTSPQAKQVFPLAVLLRGWLVQHVDLFNPLDMPNQTSIVTESCLLIHRKDHMVIHCKYLHLTTTAMQLERIY